VSIVFEGIWKRFQRGEQHDSLRDLLPAIARMLLGRKPPLRGDRDFWALRDVSFEVSAGQAGMKSLTLRHRPNWVEAMKASL